MKEPNKPANPIQIAKASHDFKVGNLIPQHQGWQGTGSWPETGVGNPAVWISHTSAQPATYTSASTLSGQIIPKGEQK